MKELQDYRKKRSQSLYERAGIVTSTEADAALTSARRLREQLLAWLSAHHPNLHSG